MSTPDLHLNTLFILDGAGRIISTREPGAHRGPLFFIVRGATGCAWAMRADVPQDVASELDGRARAEPPALDLRDPPVYADRYVSLLASEHDAVTKLRHSNGPAFTFPDSLAPSAGVVVVEDERLLERNFRGWVPGEIAAGRSPVLAVVEDAYPVSVCFAHGVLSRGRGRSGHG